MIQFLTNLFSVCQQRSALKVLQLLIFLALRAEFAVTLKQFRKHIQYMNVLGLVDMELTFSTAVHKCYSWQRPALLVAIKQLLEVASEFLFDLHFPNTHFLLYVLI